MTSPLRPALLVVGTLVVVAAGAVGFRFSRTHELEPIIPPSPVATVVDGGAVAAPPGQVPLATPATPAQPHGQEAEVARFVDGGAETDRLPPDLEERLPAVTSASDVAAVVAMLRRRDEGDAERNEAINLLRRSRWPGLDDELVARLDDDAESARLRAFAAQHLGVSLAEAADSGSRQRVIARLRAALGDRELAVRREALLGLVRIDEPQARAAARDGLGDPAWAGAQDLVIHCLTELDARDRLAAVRERLGDSDEVVRIAAITAVAHWRDEASRPALLAAQASGTDRVRRAAALALERMVGSAAAAAAADPAAVAPH